MFFLALTGLIIYNMIEFNIHDLNKKTKFNNISGIHIISSITLTSIALYYDSPLFYALSKTNTLGYFINDALCILKYKERNFYNYVIFYHHVSGCMFLMTTGRESYSLVLTLVAEISNIPTYFIYNYLHTSESSKIKINLCKRLQLLIYCFIRLFLVPYFGYLEFYLEKDLISTIGAYSTIPLVFMGFMYSYVLFKKHYYIKND